MKAKSFLLLPVFMTGIAFAGETLYPDRKPVCNLLSIQEIQNVLNESVENGNERSDMICEYRRASQRNTPQELILTLRLDYANKAPQQALDIYHMVMKIGLGDSYQPLTVTGIGDLAIWDKHSRSLVTFKSLGESRSAMVTVKPENKDAQKAQAAAKALAQIALEKL